MMIYNKEDFKLMRFKKKISVLNDSQNQTICHSLEEETLKACATSGQTHKKKKQTCALVYTQTVILILKTFDICCRL